MLLRRKVMSQVLEGMKKGVTFLVGIVPTSIEVVLLEVCKSDTFTPLSISNEISTVLLVRL